MHRCGVLWAEKDQTGGWLLRRPGGPRREQRHSDGAVPPGFVPHAPDAEDAYAGAEGASYAGVAYQQPPLLSGAPDHAGFSTMPPPAFYVRKLTAASERNSL